MTLIFTNLERLSLVACANSSWWARLASGFSSSAGCNMLLICFLILSRDMIRGLWISTGFAYADDVLSRIAFISSLDSLPLPSDFLLTWFLLRTMQPFWLGFKLNVCWYCCMVDMGAPKDLVLLLLYRDKSISFLRCTDSNMFSWASGFYIVYLWLMNAGSIEFLFLRWCCEMKVCADFLRQLCSRLSTSLSS